MEDIGFEFMEMLFFHVVTDDTRSFCTLIDDKINQKAHTNQRDDIESFIDQRSPTNGRNILHEAAVLGRLGILKYLLSKTNADIDRPTMMGRASALQLAASNGHRSVVFLLLSYGANPVCRDRFGCTPLHYAATRNIARLLIEYGARVSIFNKKKMNSLHSAEKRNVDKSHLKYLEEVYDKEYREDRKKLIELKNQRLNSQKKTKKRRAMKQLPEKA